MFKVSILVLGILISLPLSWSMSEDTQKLLLKKNVNFKFYKEHILNDQNCQANEKKFLSCIRSINSILLIYRDQIIIPQKILGLLYGTSTSKSEFKSLSQEIALVTIPSSDLAMGNLKFNVTLKIKESLRAWKGVLETEKNISLEPIIQYIGEGVLNNANQAELSLAGLKYYYKQFYDDHVSLEVKSPLLYRDRNHEEAQKLQKEQLHREMSWDVLSYGDQLYFYIKIKSFSLDMDVILAHLLQDELHLKQYSGILMDLRDNFGGYFISTVETADLFLSRGSKIAYLKPLSTEMGLKEEAYISESKALTTLPIVVMVNSGTASSAEVLAQALNDNGRAYLVGENTYGKATVQEPQTFKPNENLWLYRSRYLILGPNGYTYSSTGLMPHFKVFNSNFLNRSYRLSDFEINPVSIQGYRRGHSPNVPYPLKKCVEQWGQAPKSYHQAEKENSNDYQLLYSKDVLYCLNAIRSMKANGDL